MKPVSFGPYKAKGYNIKENQMKLVLYLTLGVVLQSELGVWLHKEFVYRYNRKGDTLKR